VDICNLFFDFFASVYAQPSSNPPEFNYDTTTSFSSCRVRECDILRKLATLDGSKGCGPDNIPPCVLKHCSHILATPLTYLFNELLKDGIFPSCLKTSFVIPIHKSGKCDEVSNYRPIVIQCTLAKTLESLVLNIISPAFKNIIVDEQHGFFSGRSTTSYLAVYQKFVLSCFDDGAQVDSVYLAFAKAFDRVCFLLLLAKLKGYGFGGAMLAWFASYLFGSLLVVKFGGSKSRLFAALSGVPQGSHLGPFLFLLFINDLTRSSIVRWLVFADDVKLFIKVLSIADCALLQGLLDDIVAWCDVNCMMLNSTKCSVITFHRSLNPFIFAYTLNGIILCRTSTVRDLGIVLNSKLTYHDHIEAICLKANKMLGFINLILKDGFSLKSLKMLYMALVRPVLEYGSVIWAPYQENLCHRLQSCQNRLVRLIGVRLGFRYFEVPVPELERFLGIPPLNSRRVIQDLLFLHKLLNGSVRCAELLGLIDFRIPSTRRFNDLFARRFYRTEYLRHSTLPRLMSLGNSCCKEIDFFTDSVVVVRRKLKAILNNQ